MHGVVWVLAQANGNPGKAVGGATADMIRQFVLPIWLVLVACAFMFLMRGSRDRNGAGLLVVGALVVTMLLVDPSIMTKVGHSIASFIEARL